MSGLNCQALVSANWRGAGMSAGLPRGAPASTQRPIVAISSLVSDGSFLNEVMPIDLSMWKGGISCDAVRALMERAHGRASS